MRRATALTALLILAPATYEASDWQPIGVTTELSPLKTPVSGDMFLDNDSVVKTPTYVKAWVRTVFKSDVFNPKNRKRFRVEKALWVVDCDNRTMGVAQIIYQTAAGKPSVEYSIDPVFVSLKDVVPDTVGEDVLQDICKVAAKLPS